MLFCVESIMTFSLAQGIRPATPRVVPFATYILFLILGSLLMSVAQHAHWDPRWLYGVKIACVALVLGCFWRGYAELHRAPAPSARDWQLAVVVGLLVFVLWINLDQPWASIGAPAVFDASREGGGIDWSLVAVRWIGAALVVPLMEELFWRSFVLRWLQRQDFWRLAPAQITMKVSLITAVLFAVEHNLWLAGLAAGFAYNWLYIRTGKLWVPVIAHAVTNGALGVWVVTTRNWQFW